MITGTLPTELGNLSSLKYMEIGKNCSFWDTLQMQFGKMNWIHAYFRSNLILS